MFGFRKTILNPVLGSLLQDLNGVLQQNDVTAKTEQLISLKEETSRAFDRLNFREIVKTGVGVGGILTGLVGLTAVLVAAAPVTAVAAIGAGIAGLTGYVLKKAQNIDRAATAEAMLTCIINKEVSTMAEKFPAEVKKSPRFTASAADAFNCKSSMKTDLARLTESLRPGAKWALR